MYSTCRAVVNRKFRFSFWKTASIWQPLSSFEGKSKRSGEYFVDSTYYDSKSVENGCQSFRDLHVHSEVEKILRNEWNIAVPTEVQRRSLPHAMTRKSCIIQSPTGSGKTLCFLLPAIQERSPGLSTLILVPTRELAQQVHRCAAILAGNKKTSKRLELLVSGYSEEADPKDDNDQSDGLEKVALESSPNIVIGTPKRVLEAVQDGAFDLQYLRRIIMDECDKLLLSKKRRNSWRTRKLRIRHPRPAASILFSIKEKLKGRYTQLICTSATADCGVEGELKELGWKGALQMVQCSTSREVPPNIEHHYLPLQTDSQDDVVNTLVHLFRQNKEPSSLVFIHRESGIDRFVIKLREKGLRTVALYEKTFESGEFADFVEMFKSGEVQLAVGTEETVRGLDFPWVGSVYLTEVPRNVEEYLHLCGRVGRLNQRGRAVVLVSNPAKDLPRLLRYYRSLGVEGSDVSSTLSSRLLDTHTSSKTQHS